MACAPAPDAALLLQVITATPRQLESGVRLAEALARMRLSADVTPDDVQEGLRLMKVRGSSLHSRRDWDAGSAVAPNPRAQDQGC
jgi:DNA replicative helicase MCM subunit Mcm2 (Cdc46/Mcm family)